MQKQYFTDIAFKIIHARDYTSSGLMKMKLNNRSLCLIKEKKIK